MSEQIPARGLLENVPEWERDDTDEVNILVRIEARLDTIAELLCRLVERGEPEPVPTEEEGVEDPNARCQVAGCTVAGAHMGVRWVSNAWRFLCYRHGCEWQDRVTAADTRSWRNEYLCAEPGCGELACHTRAGQVFCTDHRLADVDAVAEPENTTRDRPFATARRRLGGRHGIE